MKYQRILLKLSGEALSSDGKMFDYSKIDMFAQKIVGLMHCGLEVAVVCGAGNIWRYKDTRDAGIDRVKSDHLGMMATVMNAVLLNEKVFHNKGRGVVMCPRGMHIPPLTKEYNSLTARDKMSNGKVAFCAGGSGNPYSTTDLGAVLRALELECDLLIKATKVDGVYDKDPKKYPDAVKFDTLSLSDAHQQRLNIMDHSAMAMATDNNLPIFVCNMNRLEDIGTDRLKGTLLS